MLFSLICGFMACEFFCSWFLVLGISLEGEQVWIFEFGFLDWKIEEQVLSWILVTLHSLHPHPALSCATSP